MRVPSITIPPVITRSNSAMIGPPSFCAGSAGSYGLRRRTGRDPTRPVARTIPLRAPAEQSRCYPNCDRKAELALARLHLATKARAPFDLLPPLTTKPGESVSRLTAQEKDQKPTIKRF